MNAMLSTVDHFRRMLSERIFVPEKNPAPRRNSMIHTVKDEELDFKDFDYGALEEIVRALEPIFHRNLHDEVLSKYAIKADLEDPLDSAEIKVLAVALLADSAVYEGTFSCSDVLESTNRISGRTMNTTMVYKTVDRLQKRALIEDAGRSVDPHTERTSKKFRINALGRVAFRIAITYSQVLEAGQEKQAA